MRKVLRAPSLLSRVALLSVKSFKIGKKDIFDCVDIYKQPSLRHPLLVNHTIQLELDTSVDIRKSVSSKTAEPSGSTEEVCPLGTVPIKRITTKPDLLEMRKHAQHIKINSFNQMKDEHDTTNNYAAMVVIFPQKDDEFYGAEAVMDVYRISGIKDDQVSNGQVILIKGNGGPRKYINTIQFGWTVYNGVNGDKEPHLFVYWTSDDYQNTGCFNTVCKGFVQVSNKLHVGMAIPPAKNAIKLRLYRSPDSGNWLLLWAQDGGMELIGYFPREIFNNMNDAVEVQVGGVAFAPSNESVVPAMGSGVRPGDGGDVCTFTEVAMLSSVGNPRAWGSSRAFVSDRKRNLYGVSEPQSNQIAFGGPGGNRFN